MRKELDTDTVFAKWGRPGEKPDSEWLETFTENLRKEGKVVGIHEWCGSYTGEHVVYAFRGIFISEDEVDICGPFETFVEAARAVDLFHVTAATTRLWVDPELLRSSNAPLDQRSSMTEMERASEPSLQEQVSSVSMHEHEKAWAEEREALHTKLAASGLEVRTPGTNSPQQIIATFHNPSLKIAGKALPKSGRDDND